MAMDQGQAVLTRQIKAVRGRPDQRPNLASIRVPTLIMAGTEDILCPKTASVRCMKASLFRAGTLGKLRLSSDARAARKGQ